MRESPDHPLARVAAGALRALTAATAFLPGCGLFTGHPPPPPVVDPPTTSKVYANAASPEDKKCYQSGACDTFKLGWAPKTSVRIHLDTPEHTAWMTVRCPGSSEVRVETKRGEPTAKVELIRTDKPGLCHILVAARGYEDGGDYTLAVGPPPSEEGELPRPPIPDEARLAKVLAQRAAEPGFSMSAKDRDRNLKDELKRYDRVGGRSPHASRPSPRSRSAASAATATSPPGSSAAAPRGQTSRSAV